MQFRKNVIINVCKLVTRLLSVVLFYDFDKEVDQKIVDLINKNKGVKNDKS